MSGDNTAEGTPLIDRPQGVLTSTERDVLLSSDQFNARGREARSRVRRRLGDALIDYIVLDEELPHHDFVQVFDSPDEEVQGHVVEGLKAQVRFIYRAAETAGFDAERLISDAVEEVKGERLEQLVARFQDDPEALTVDELSTLVQTGEISREEYDDVVSGSLRPPIGNIDPGEVEEYDDLETFLEAKVAKRRQR